MSKLGKVRKTAIDGRTLRHPGHAISQRRRKRLAEVFGWIKAAAGLASVKVRGKPRAGATFTRAVAACNPGSRPGQALIRIPKLLAKPAS